MYDKNKCEKCKHKSNICTIGVYCNYSLSGKTCTTREGDKIIDRRGNDPKKCQLYERG